MFSAIERYGDSASSWWMMTMPAASESLMERNSTGSPLITIWPSNVPCGYTPDSTFISVDLPAPFSPQIAWTDPSSTLIETSCSALTPGKDFEMFCISRIVLAMVSLAREGGPGRLLPARTPVRPVLLEVGLLVVAAVDQDLLVVVLGHDDRLEQVARDDLHLVVVALGV